MPAYNITYLSTNLRSIRISRGYSIRELARRAGYYPKTIREIEAGRNLNPQLRTVLDLAQALNINLFLLLSPPGSSNSLPQYTAAEHTFETLLSVDVDYDPEGNRILLTFTNDRTVYLYRSRDQYTAKIWSNQIGSQYKIIRKYKEDSNFYQDTIDWSYIGEPDYPYPYLSTKR